MLMRLDYPETLGDVRRVSDYPHARGASRRYQMVQVISGIGMLAPPDYDFTLR